MPNYIYLIFIYCFSFSFLSDVIYAVWSFRGFALYGLLPSLVMLVGRGGSWTSADERKRRLIKRRKDKLDNQFTFDSR
jgi:hypothetical protein